MFRELRNWFIYDLLRLGGEGLWRERYLKRHHDLCYPHRRKQ